MRAIPVVGHNDRDTRDSLLYPAQTLTALAGVALGSTKQTALQCAQVSRPITRTSVSATERPNYDRTGGRCYHEQIFSSVPIPRCACTSPYADASFLCRWRDWRDVQYFICADFPPFQRRDERYEDLPAAIFSADSEKAVEVQPGKKASSTLHILPLVCHMCCSRRESCRPKKTCGTRFGSRDSAADLLLYAAGACP
jgi:hypothetical protein